MANEPDGTEQFDRLLQLLAVKRDEQPPPGFFDRFPREVRRQIMAQDNPHASWLSQLKHESNWLRLALAMMEGRPALAGVFGVLACGLLIAGILYASDPRLPSTSLARDDGLAPSAMPALIADDSLPWASAADLVSSTNPIPNRPVPAMLFNGSLLQSQPALLDLK
jgi:hypothetical protein